MGFHGSPWAEAGKQCGHVGLAGCQPGSDLCPLLSPPVKAPLLTVSLTLIGQEVSHFGCFPMAGP